MCILTCIGFTKDNTEMTHLKLGCIFRHLVRRLWGVDRRTGNCSHIVSQFIRAVLNTARSRRCESVAHRWVVTHLFTLHTRISTATKFGMLGKPPSCTLTFYIVEFDLYVDPLTMITQMHSTITETLLQQHRERQISQRTWWFVPWYRGLPP